LVARTCEVCEAAVLVGSRFGALAVGLSCEAWGHFLVQQLVPKSSYDLVAELYPALRPSEDDSQPLVERLFAWVALHQSAL
jgi:hypothetical protein